MNRPAATFPRRVLLLAALLLPLAAVAQTLTVSAASSLTEAFKEIAGRFEAARPGVVVRLNFGSSGLLMQQIAQGAPVDLFASADEETMNRGAAQQLFEPATRRDFAANVLVLVVPAQDAPPVAKLADLAGPAVRRIAIGKPATVPVGRYAQQALEAAALWAPLAPKFVQADNVRQVLDYVARGEAEAGFVYRTDAALLAGKVRVVTVVEGHAPVRYPLAVVADSRQPALAREFAAFVLGAEGQGVLARQGFGKP